MLRWLFRSRDYGGVVVFLLVLAIFFYAFNTLLALVSQVKIPFVSSRSGGDDGLFQMIAAPSPSPRAGASPVIVAESPEAAPGRAASPTATPGTMRRVGNTGGEGVYVRRTPRLADRIRAWPDNSQMTLLGETAEADGLRWQKVRDPAGNEGWMPEQYLVQP